MAIAKAGTDTSTSGNTMPGTDSSLSHTLVSGTARKVIVMVAAENGAAIDVSGVTYGGQAMTLAVDYEQPVTGYRQFCAIWYIDEADLPSDGVQTIAVTFAGTNTSCEYSIYCAEYTGIAQGSPDDTDTNYQTTSPIANTLSAIATGAWAFSVASCGNTGSYTWNESQVELLDFTDASSQHGIAELRGGSGQTSLNTTFTGTVNRLARICAVWSELSGPAITDVDTDEEIDDEQASVVVTGTNFGSSDTGSADVEIGDDSDYATANKISQPRSSWSATSITISAVDLGTQSPGTKWIWVTGQHWRS